jgi:hypothetical protein
VAVGEARGGSYIVLDEDYRMLEVAPSVESVFGDFLGQNVWELFPGSHAIFASYLEAAHRTGEPVEFVQFYQGTVVRIEAAPQDGLLHVSWEVLGAVDVSTLENMRASLGHIESVLTEKKGAQEDGHSGRRLRVVKRGN